MRAVWVCGRLRTVVFETMAFEWSCMVERVCGAGARGFSDIVGGGEWQVGRIVSEAGIIGLRRGDLFVVVRRRGWVVWAVRRVQRGFRKRALERRLAVGMCLHWRLGAMSGLGGLEAGLVAGLAEGSFLGGVAGGVEGSVARLQAEW